MKYNVTMSKRRKNYSPEFKVKVVKRLFTGEKSVSELSKEYGIAPITINRWYEQFEENLPGLFSKGDQEAKKQIEGLEEELAVYQQKVGQLTIERDWLKKKSDEIFGPNGPHRNRFRG